ncbi:MAG: sugar phosphate isomerase/epimerase family protein [Planctomycetota bacterium]|jgi:sugar phosphate isomerase/epimerase
MFTLSAFADEVSADFTEQMDVLEREGVKHIELRGVWGKNVLDLTDDEVARVKEESAARGFGFSAIGSPIGKIKIGDDFKPHVERFRRALWVAKELSCPGIRLFSYNMPKGEDPAGSRDEVMRRMRAKVEIAEAEGVTLLHENERDIYGDTGERCLDILNEVKSDRLEAIFDPANFVQCGEDTLECWGKLKSRVKYFHVKDSRADCTVTPAGEGDGRFVEIFTEAVAMGFDGFASLEPHLQHAGRSEGKTGPELFKVAADALKGVIAKAGTEIRKA